MLLSMEVLYPRLTALETIESDLAETVETFDSALRARGFRREGEAYAGG